MSKYRSPQVSVGLAEAQPTGGGGTFTVSRAVPGEVALELARPAEIAATLVSLSGATRVLARKHFPTGRQRLLWEAGGLAPGVHFLRIEGAGTREIRAITAL